MAMDAADQQRVMKWITEMMYTLDIRRVEVSKLFDAFQGKQRLAFATNQWQQLHQNRYKDFSDNWCGVVGRAAVDRHEIKGFRLGDKTDQRTTGEQNLWADWNRNEMAAQSNQGFLSAIVAKRSSVLVWGDKNELPVMTWEHPSQVTVVYDPDTRQPIRALKWWADEEYEYATLYRPDFVWKFSRKASGAAVVNAEGFTRSGIFVPTAVPIGVGGWEPRQPAGDDVWPLPNPLGEVPIVEWNNRPLLGGDPISDIEGTMAMQHAINLMWAYLFVAADYASMPARIVLGAPPELPILDENGQQIGTRPAKLEDLAAGKVVFLPGASDVKSWEAAKLDVFTGVVQEAIEHTGSQTSTPGHYLLNKGMANLNGDALTAAEVPLATKVGNQQLHFNPASKRTTRLMALVRGDKDTAQRIAEADSQRFTHWKDGAMHSLAQVADAATKDRSIGMSLRTVLEERYGFTDAQIDQEMERIKEEASDPILEAAVKGLAAGAGSFASGN